MPRRNDIRRILILGSGPIVIGQACEFDYSGTQACKALKQEGFEVILVNSNPASIMTDPKRLLFNWSNTYINSNKVLGKYKQFQTTWELSDDDYNNFLDYLSSELKDIDLDEIKKDEKYYKVIEEYCA